MPQLPVEILWLGLCTGLVFVMQAGFLCLESGLTRSKNNINVAVKNLADLGLSLILFWGVGYGLMYGVSYGGVIGLSDFGRNLQTVSGGQTVIVLYQAMFCGTAVTILSGAIAERVKFKTYLLIAAVTSGLVYPIFGHWMWSDSGWLKLLGVHDFAGSTVVHSLGGWVALALLMIVGPRAGRFSDSGEPIKITGSSLPTATLGALILWFGWFGFNGGSTMGILEDVPTRRIPLRFLQAERSLWVRSVRWLCSPSIHSY